MNSNIAVYSIPALKDNYIWCIVNSAVNMALIVDPGEADPVINYLSQKQLILKGILITHHHWDHTQGLANLLKKYEVPVFASKKSEVPSVTSFMNEQDTIKIDSFPDIHIIEIPGHTIDHIAYHFDTTLFCGDTLFSAGCGKIFEGTGNQLYHSLQKILKLPDDIKIYCAHEYTLKNLLFARVVEPHNPYLVQRILEVKKLRDNNQPSLPSTLRIEKNTNPFLRCDIPDIIQTVEHHAGKPLKSACEIFSELRTWKNHF